MQRPPLFLLCPFLVLFFFSLIMTPPAQSAESTADVPADAALKEDLRRQILGVLQRRGVAPFGARGEPFDPRVHEAVGTVTDPGLPEGTVAGVERAGYRDQSGAVLRPASVVVAR